MYSKLTKMDLASALDPDKCIRKLSVIIAVNINLPI